MADDVVSVLTFKSVKTILESGGTQSWVLDPNRAKKCKFAVICRNSKTWEAEGPEDHGTAFMVGLIKDVIPSTEDDGRWLIRFSEYALCSWPDQWDGRNPVAYWTTDDYEVEGGFDDLVFQPMPTPHGFEEAPAGLTIAGAKAALAKSLGVPISSIEITIKA